MERMRTHRAIFVWIGALSLGLLAGCEIPQAPEWEVGLLVPFTRQSLGIDSLLPVGVQVAEVNGESVFLVDTDEESASYTLGVMCPACASRQGNTTTVPTFDFTDTLEIRLPTGVIAVDVAILRLDFRVTNGLNFDPLRPNPDPDSAGRVEIQALDMESGTLLDSLLLSGANESLPAGTSRDGSLEIRDATITGGLRIVAHLHSPEDGQTVEVDTLLTASVETLTDTIAVSGITAEVRDEGVRENFRVRFDPKVRRDVREDVVAAVLELELLHSLDVVGLMEVSLAGTPSEIFSGTAGEIRLEPIDFSAAPDGRTTIEELTPVEIDFLTGLDEIHIGFTGTASARTLDSQGRPAVTFTPTDSISARLKITTTISVEP